MKVETPYKWGVINQQLTKTFIFESFVDAMKFVNLVAELAEEQEHHPDIEIRYNIVVVKSWTHDTGEVGELDLQLANSIDVKLNQLK